MRATEGDRLLVELFLLIDTFIDVNIKAPLDQVYKPKLNLVPDRVSAGLAANERGSLGGGWGWG